MTHDLFRPSAGFVPVAGRARIGNFVSVRHRRGNKAKSVGVNKRSGYAFGFDRRHMASHALVAGAARFVMSVFSKCG